MELMRKEGLEELILPGQSEGKRGIKKHCITYLESFSKWIVEQVLGEITKIK